MVWPASSSIREAHLHCSSRAAHAHKHGARLEVRALLDEASDTPGWGQACGLLGAAKRTRPQDGGPLVLL